MPLDICRITNFDPSLHEYYFLDSNVWITALKYYTNSTLDSEKKAYLDFFESIINLNVSNDPDSNLKIKYKPKLVLNSLLLSEIINTYMRVVAMSSYFNDKEAYKKYNFKSAYRDAPNSDYNKQLKNLITDLIAIKEYTILFDDNFKELKPFEFINELSSSIDYNDLFYLKFLQNKNIPFVTDDKDCNIPNLKIITNNKKLLRKAIIC